MFDLGMITQRPDAEQPELDVRWHRSLACQAIARTLYSQWCIEQGQSLQRIEEANPDEARRFHQWAEFVTNFLLEPDRADAAMVAAADVCVGSGFLRADNAPTIFELSRRVQQQHLATARGVLQALMDYVKEVCPDQGYREECSTLLDRLEPKDGAR